jgi:Putative Actinobacterial Holin-X, holin superfamily III
MWGRRSKGQDSDSGAETSDAPPLSFGDLIKQLFRDVDLLIRNEFRMMQAEFSDKIRQALSPLTLILVGVVLLIGGTFTLIGALVAWLTPLVGAGFAALIVAIGAGSAGWALILRGREQISGIELMPSRVAQMMNDGLDPTEGQDR